MCCHHGNQLTGLLQFDIDLKKNVRSLFKRDDHVVEFSMLYRSKKLEDHSLKTFEWILSALYSCMYCQHINHPFAIEWKQHLAMQ